RCSPRRAFSPPPFGRRRCPPAPRDCGSPSRRSTPTMKSRALPASCGSESSADDANGANQTRHSGTARSAGPGIQPQAPHLFLDSGFAPIGARYARTRWAHPGMTRKNMSAYFVTSTGTDIGKTFVTAGLIRYLRQSSQPVAALKPIVSGYDPSVVETSDPAVLLTALGRPVTAAEVNRIAPWRFRAPVSPDLAAAREGRNIDFDQLIAFS